MSNFPLVAADIGNSRIKLGLFRSAPAPGQLPAPDDTLTLDRDWNHDAFSAWAMMNASARWIVASVNRASLARLQQSLAERCPNTQVHVLSNRDLPIAVRLPQPERVGVDRLLGAIAANHVRRPDRAAIIVHVGTAITVNLVGSDGAFLGGAIAPGIALAARALHEHTDLLPQLELDELTIAPPVVGMDTHAALTSGLFWGAIGAIKELIARMSVQAGGDCQVLLTGGAAPSIAPLIGAGVVHVPHLVLAGIALASAAANLADGSSGGAPP
jgi:type III pantothenate kinase